MQQREIKLEQIEQTIRKVLARGGEFSFYPGGTSMQPFIVQGRDKVTLAALPDRIKSMISYCISEKTVHLCCTG